MIDILVPVLSRPQNAQPLVDSIRANTTVPHRILFLLTFGDDEEGEAVSATDCEYWTILSTGSGEYAKKINAGFRMTDDDLVFQAADDIEFSPGWDIPARIAMKPGIGVVATNDQANRQVMRGEYGTHNLIRRSYIDEYGGTFDNIPGVVLHEGYDHWFVDRELCDAAKQRGAYAFAKNSVVRHRHPFFDRSLPTDATYEKGQARAREDQALYMSRSPLFKRRQRDIIAR